MKVETKIAKELLNKFIELSEDFIIVEEMRECALLILKDMKFESEESREKVEQEIKRLTGLKSINN